MTKWVKVSEYPPTGGLDVLVLDSFLRMGIAWYDPESGKWRGNAGYANLSAIIYWADTPDLPQEEIDKLYARVEGRREEP